MNAKTITISAKAYKRLGLHKRDDESISDTIVRIIKPPLNVKQLIASLRKLDPGVMKSVDDEITARRQRPARRRAE